MKITIAPTEGPDSHHYDSVTIDTGNNNETTSKAVATAINALVSYGHHIENIKSACADFSADPE